MKKLRQKGFTLAELLVAVAIIGVLVAVSIPIFSSQTEKAKAATDMANVRAAKAAAVAEYLTGGTTNGAVYYYDAASGTVTTDATAAAAFKGYGKSSKEVSNATGIPNEKGTAHIVCITIKEDGTQTASWTLGIGGGGSGGASPLDNLESSDWSALTETARYGINIPAGTIVKEGSSRYLFFANSDYYSGDLRNTQLSAIYTSGTFAGRVEKIDDSIHIYTEADFLSTFDGKNTPAGTIAYYGGVYLVEAETSPANKDNLPRAGHTNWVAIK